MLNTSKLRKQHRQRQIAKLSRFAETLDDKPSADKQDQMLAGLDDGWDAIRNKIIELAAEDGEWAGYPLPIDDATLQIEPRHPLYRTLNGATTGDKPTERQPDGDWKIANQWRDRRGWWVTIEKNEQTGRARRWIAPHNASTGRLEFLLTTLGASRAWSVSAEFTAMQRLKTIIKPTAFRYYLLVGMFLETSQRSGITYLFRKGRPTVALSSRAGYMKPLAALCLHPIGYYTGTYAGSMVPTDDLIAHLLMMRGDEWKFWSKCNQHECHVAEAGV